MSRPGRKAWIERRMADIMVAMPSLSPEMLARLEESLGAAWDAEKQEKVAIQAVESPLHTPVPKHATRAVLQVIGQEGVEPVLSTTPEHGQRCVEILMQMVEDTEALRKDRIGATRAIALWAALDLRRIALAQAARIAAANPQESLQVIVDAMKSRSTQRILDELTLNMFKEIEVADGRSEGNP